MSAHAIELDAVADEWQHAFDAAASALDAATRELSPDDVRARRHALALERADTERDLTLLAAALGTGHTPWLSATQVRPHALGLPDHIRACVFDLDGVLTDSGTVQAAAWAEVFDDLLLRLSERPGWRFVPFDRDVDYRAYLDGRPRFEGIQLFLQGRGIQLSAEAANRLARRKSEALARALRHRGINALPGARRYLEAAGRAGLGRAVVSSSTRTLPMLELADLDSLVDARVDAEQIAAGELRSRPAPDLPRRACELLAVPTERTAAVVHTPDGVAAGRAAGLVVIGVAADEESQERLRAFGADAVVGGLETLLDRSLRATELDGGHRIRSFSG